MTGRLNMGELKFAKRSKCVPMEEIRIYGMEALDYFI